MQCQFLLNVSYDFLCAVSGSVIYDCKIWAMSSSVIYYGAILISSISGSGVYYFALRARGGDLETKTWLWF